MSNVAPFKTGGLAGLDTLQGGLANVTNTTPGRTAGNPILRMGRDGVWMYGAENIVPQEGSHWAMNPGSIKHGYVAWVRNSDPSAKAELKGEAMVPASAIKPDLNALDKFDNAPWADQLQIDLLCLNGEDEGTTVTYKVSSIGGREALLKLIGQIMVKAGKGLADVVPVVELLNSFYNHRKWNRVYTPVFSIVDWLTGLEEDPSAATAANQEANAKTPPPPPASGPAPRPPAAPAGRAPVGAAPTPTAAVAKPRTRKAAPAAAPEPAPVEEAPGAEEPAPFEPDAVEAAPVVRRRRVAN